MGNWTTWLLMGGRGSGKTRAGAEWVRSIAMADPPETPIALVGETILEALAVMVRGPSGLLAAHPHKDRPKLVGTTLTWPNGAEAQVFGATDADRFRGPQFAAAWCDELGCGAVDKGANQPNAFGDQKSSEDLRPYFSTGTPDPLIQRQVLRASLDWWGGEDDARNPTSAVYDGPMVDPSRIYLWTWDARPFPAFPADRDTWSDGANHETGHWLTGRLGALAADELVAAIAADNGLELGDVAVSPPLIYGAALSGAPAARDLLAALTQVAGLDVRDGAEGVEIVAGSGTPLAVVEQNGLVSDGRALLTLRRPDPTEAVVRLAVTYGERARDYLAGSVTALAPGQGATRGETLPLVLETSGARRAAEALLAGASARARLLEVTLPASALAVEPGDRMALDGLDGTWRIIEMRDGLARRVTAREEVSPLPVSLTAERAAFSQGLAVAAAVPALVVAHLPGVAGAESQLVLGVRAKPWPEWVDLTESGTGASLGRVLRGASIGTLAAPLAVGPLWVWDEANALELTLFDTHVSTRTDAEILAGANRLAVETPLGWEVIGFARAELLAPHTYRLTRLLRGQGGTDPAMAEIAPGARVLLLDDRPVWHDAPEDWLGETVTLTAFAGPADAEGVTEEVTVGLGPVLPLPPALPRAIRNPLTGDIAFGWTRRSRADGDAWATTDAPMNPAPERYRLVVFNAGLPVRQVEIDSPAALYTATEQGADFGGLPASFTFTIAQESPLFGMGHAAQGAFNE